MYFKPKSIKNVFDYKYQKSDPQGVGSCYATLSLKGDYYRVSTRVSGCWVSILRCSALSNHIHMAGITQQPHSSLHSHAELEGRDKKRLSLPGDLAFYSE